MEKSTWKHISRYELPLFTCFGVMPFWVLKTNLQAFYQTNIDYLRNWQTIILTWVIVVMFTGILWSFAYYLWINIYGLFPPIPFGGFTIGMGMLPFVYAALWFMIPKSARKEKELKRRFVMFLVSRLYDILGAFLYKYYFTILFILIPSDYQPILGFVCPLIRDLLLKILNFITYRAGGGRTAKIGKYFLNF
jgi:hypothetical protein